MYNCKKSNETVLLEEEFSYSHLNKDGVLMQITYMQKQLIKL